MTTLTADIHATFRAAEDRFESVFGRGDSAGLADLYTDDGMVLPTGADMLQGKEAIAAFWQGAMDMGIKSAKLDIVELEQHDDTAIEIGRYTLSGAEGQVLDQGKYLIVWKHQDDTWKLHRDIFNTSLAQQ